ncbi:hypothetical protein RD792_003930 [Penstemon davidsonii]|uniref:Probable purine permease n=1 Tax=Penstemon davidsonii TaxID=160366 RepID=A0ABR0DG18_9LAMI|nr:hypothetical protein RD792_003930 [Penstemon davidsonii]
MNLSVPDEEIKETNSHSSQNATHPKQYRIWIQMAIYSFMVISGQSTATLLGRLYYEKGGKNKYIAALVQSAGFPIILPLLYISSKKNPTSNSTGQSKSSLNLVLASLYVAFGTFLALECMLYAVGLMYLPVSTFSLICASQLGFNAFFSYFINSQKITPFILNSIVLLTISTTLLVLNSDSLTSDVNKKYTLGLICTLGGTSGYALLLSVQQLAYGKLLKRQTFKEILNVILFESMVTTFALLVGLFGSGEWRSLRNEMEGFELGRKLYLVILIGSALAWQVFGIGMVALILKVSSLYANVVSTLNVPFVPVLGVLIFEDRMNGIKVVAMLLAVWGSVSYVYQKYVDDVEVKEENVNVEVQRD